MLYPFLCAVLPMQPVCGVLRQRWRLPTGYGRLQDAARMWCAEAKRFMDEAAEHRNMMQPVCGVLRQSLACAMSAAILFDAARMWCAEAKFAVQCPVRSLA